MNILERSNSIYYQYAAILGLVCRLLAGKGRGNLSTFCPKLVTTITRRSQRLHNYDPVNHLRFKNPCDFRTLDRFLRSWQVTAVTLWDQLPADLLLRGERDGWRTILKDVQKCFNDNVYMPVCTYLAIDHEVHCKKCNSPERDTFVKQLEL